MTGISKVNRAGPGTYIFLLVFIIVSLFPIVWLLLSSFKSAGEITRLPPVWFPEPSIKNYVAIFSSRPFGLYTFNSVSVTLTVTVLCVIIGTPAAYGFSRFRFAGSQVMFFTIIASRLFPPVSFVVPFTILFSNLGLIDTRLSLVLVNLFLNLPFVVWILIGFFESIPRALDDSARVDGCNKRQAFWHIILPQVRPGIIAGAILAFIMTWNEFLFALAFTRTEAKTLVIGITDFYADNFVVWNHVTAASMYATIPAIIFVLIFQRHLIRGMLAGAVKG